LLFSALRRLGYVEGRNLVIERYSAEGQPARLAILARQAVERNPDLIIAIGDPVAHAFATATGTIPIIATFADSVGSGLVQSLARPGSNITGVSVDTGVEIAGKRLQILKEAVPSTTKAAYLDVGLVPKGAVTAFLADASHRLGISLRVMPVKDATRAEYERVFEVMVQEKIDAVLVSDGGEPLAFRQLIAELAQQHRLPTMCAALDYVEVGGFIAYAADPTAVFDRVADDLHQIFRGTAPGLIPIIQPTSFKLVINLNTAKALNLTLPVTLLAGADGVIE
jgi:putative ABC transport system substrate-binding protein